MILKLVYMMMEAWWGKKNFREVSCYISNGWMSDVHP
jgi:hypothetical protein